MEVDVREDQNRRPDKAVVDRVEPADIRFIPTEYATSTEPRRTWFGGAFKDGFAHDRDGQA